MLHAVIMAGGAGTRFWPESRTVRPKQLLSLSGERTMIQSTVDRLRGLAPPERTLIVANEVLVSPLREQLPEIPPANIIGEPCKRDTAPCVGLAAELVRNRDPNGILLVLPADHVISPPEKFREAAAAAEKVVLQHPARIVTFGIRPAYPAAIYGYIQQGEPLGESGGFPVRRVAAFKEKPKVELAREYLAAGGYYWNAGIFVWRADTILQALARFEPAIASHVAAIGRAIPRGVESQEFRETFSREFAAIQGKSIDYAVLERYDDVAMIEAPFSWDDVGSWQSVARLQGADGQGNTIQGRHAGVRTTGCIIRGDGRRLIATIGMKDCIIVQTPDATLVADRNDEEAVRQLVALIREQGWEEYL